MSKCPSKPPTNTCPPPLTQPKAASTQAKQVYPFLPPWPPAIIRRLGRQRPSAQILGGFPTNPFNDNNNAPDISPAPPISQTQAPTQHSRQQTEISGHNLLHGAIVELRNPVARAILAVLKPHTSGTVTREQQAVVATTIAREAAYSASMLKSPDDAARNTRAYVENILQDLHIGRTETAALVNQVINAIAHPDSIKQTTPPPERQDTTPQIQPVQLQRAVKMEEYPTNLHRTPLAIEIFKALKHMGIYRNDERAAEVSNDLENRINSIAASDISLNGKKKSILMELETAIDWTYTAVNKQTTIELLKAVVSSKTQIKF